MQKKTIQIPVSLISNQYRDDDIAIPPKTTYLYVWLRMLLTDYNSYKLTIYPNTLRQELNWKTNVMLKNHISTLKSLGYITYQDDFDKGTLRPNQPLEIQLQHISKNFVQITETSIKERIIPATNQPEKAVRLCLMLKHYTNKEYGYSWLTYVQIQEWGNIRKQDIKKIYDSLEEANVLKVTVGETFRDSTGTIRKENNKYQLLVK